MYLQAILDRHRAVAREDKRSLEQLIAGARSQPSARGFANRLAIDGRQSLAVIAEIKRRSPSKGILRRDLDPSQLATQYVLGGASCISVLTDEESFGGTVSDLQSVVEATDCPVLRKDFTVSLRDVCDARIMGADCLLLIVAALDDSELVDFHQLAGEIGLDVLVEVHDEQELQRALRAGATLIGVNQRDLVTFRVDQQRALRLAPLMPQGVTKVAESGVRDLRDAQLLADAGYSAILVGESLLLSEDPAAAVASLRVKTKHN